MQRRKIDWMCAVSVITHASALKVERGVAGESRWGDAEPQSCFFLLHNAQHLRQQHWGVEKNKACNVCVDFPPLCVFFFLRDSEGEEVYAGECPRLHLRINPLLNFEVLSSKLHLLLCANRLPQAEASRRYSNA